MDLPSEKGDFIYEKGSAKLPEKAFIVLLEMHGDIDDPDRTEVAAILESLDAMKVGNAAWLVKARLSAAQIVEMFRHFFIGQEYAFVFSICGDVEWAGPRLARKFFEAFGAQIQVQEQTPNPVHPDFSSPSGQS